MQTIDDIEGMAQSAEDPQPEPERRDPHRRVARYVPVIGVLLAVIAGLMCIAIVVTAAMGYVNIPGVDSTSSRTTNQVFPVSGAPTLHIAGDVGKIVIIAGATGQVQVMATKTVSAPSASVEAALQNLSLATSQDGDTITITAHAHTSSFASNARIDLNIITPQNTALHLSNDVGDVEVEGLAGLMDITVNVGNLRLNTTTLTEDSQLKADVGDIHLTGALQPGRSLHVSVNVGTVYLTLPAAGTSAHLDAKTNVGSIKATGWPGITTNRIDVTGAHASGDLATEPAGQIVITVDTGSVNLTAN